jgi:hypothetical protein
MVIPSAAANNPTDTSSHANIHEGDSRLTLMSRGGAKPVIHNTPYGSSVGHKEDGRGVDFHIDSE